MIYIYINIFIFIYVCIEIKTLIYIYIHIHAQILTSIFTFTTYVHKFAQYIYLPADPNFCFKCYTMDCFCTYLTDAQTCDNIRVPSATQWTATVSSPPWYICIVASISTHICMQKRHVICRCKHIRIHIYSIGNKHVPIYTNICLFFIFACIDDK